MVDAVVVVVVVVWRFLIVDVLQLNGKECWLFDYFCDRWDVTESSRPQRREMLNGREEADTPPVLVLHRLKRHRLPYSITG